jgi:serine/threonine-protein kinase
VLRHDLPRALEKITLRCLEKAPANRYGSAAELAEDLERYLRGEPVEARLLTPGKRVARWARREPALVSRLATLGLCGLITQLDQQAFQRLDSSLNRRVMILITLGVMASLVFQTLLKRERWAALARYVWSTADMILFTSLMVFTGGLSSPLVAGYVLLVAASGLWFRERLVWYTAGLAVLSYSALVAFERAVGETRVPVIQPLLFVLVVVVTGFVVAYQVKRVRALSAYYETRRLP